MGMNSIDQLREDAGGEGQACPLGGRLFSERRRRNVAGLVRRRCIEAEFFFLSFFSPSWGVVQGGRMGMGGIGWGDEQHMSWFVLYLVCAAGSMIG